ncbi:PEP/pyruvate-binding domain-containing protein [Mycobacterium sp.]|uniref:PEP/pyruvate-binding domain-containing protein n=1 Tax=Mycobacterium sp. TaxID=1785 RepID=UPI0011FFDAFB|nr:PEP/pyruvate-binding domain-containing protein [Mycobacterium sp.]TAM65702.1 MAG: pyruvate, water dikinase [Mycobacterium sp.]
MNGHDAQELRDGFDSSWDSSRPVVLPLAQCSPELTDQVGGKAKGLYALIQLGLPVPAGFAITADAYRGVIAAAGIGPRVAEVLARQDLNDENKSSAIHELISALQLPVDLAAEIDAAYAELGDGPVAVRSSAIAEDTAAASFAGQHDTYLWVEGRDALHEHIKRCWGSLYNAGAIGYRGRFQVDADHTAMGVVVQRMVQAAAGGVMMTLEPVTGYRGLIFIESAHGLGEGVVVGDVLSDQFWFTKGALEKPKKTRISQQSAQYALDRATGRVTLQPLDPTIGVQPSLDASQARSLAELGAAIETAFGHPMDVEWALDCDGTLLVLQARPETVWSNRPALGTPSTMHGDLDPAQFYSTANLGEAAPGVLSPLTWSVWGPAAEIAARYGFVQMGVLERSSSGVPDDPQDRIIQIAYGRAVASVSAFYAMGERIPGASGEMLAEQLLGSVPDGMIKAATRRRYPHVAWNMPRNFARAKAVLVRQNKEITPWWTAELLRSPKLDLAGAQAQFREANQRFQEATALQAQGNIVGVPPVFDALRKVVTRAGMEDAFGALTAGSGEHAETEVVIDLWDLGHGRLSEEEFLRRHGFHGTLEGDIAGRVWREDPTPIRRLARIYRDQPDDKDPRRAGARRTVERKAAEAELLSRMPNPVSRTGARIVLWLARRNMPMRGIGKTNFLRSLDVARAAARRIGEILVATGALDTVDDIMYLTAAEISGVIPDDARTLVAERRAEQVRYRSFEIPTAFWGSPEPALAASAEPGEAAAELTGIGASAGVVEGVVRVITDPSLSEVQPGDVLVAATTDPSWASAMLISAALVVDIGGTLSHAAVVARELGIPCVVNTGTGTTSLRTGDRVRVDGASGTVEVLEQAT